MGFPGVLPRHSRWDHQSETICRVHQRSQRTTFVPDQDDVVPTACAWYTDMQCPLDQEAKFSYTAKWSSGYTDMQSSLDQDSEAKSSYSAVRLPSGLRVLFSQLLFCLVHVTQSSCPLKDAQAFQLVLRSSM